MQDPNLGLWDPQPGTCFQACPCEAIVGLTDHFDMFEKGETFGVPKKHCCWVSGVCCIVMTAQGPLAPCFWIHLARLRVKTAKKFGFEESFGKACCMSFAPGISINQIMREFVLRGAWPAAKKMDAATPAPGAVAITRN